MRTSAELRSERDDLIAEAQTLTTRSSTLAGDDLVRFEQIEAQVGAYNDELGLRGRAEELARQPGVTFTDPFVATVNSSRTADPFEGETRYAPPSELRGRAMKAVEVALGATDEARESLTQHLEQNDPTGDIAQRVLLTSSPDYVAAFAKKLAGADDRLLDRERAALERAASLTNASGGFAVPSPIDPTLIITGAGSSNPLRRISRNVSITNDTWLGLSAAQVTASWDAEAAEVSDDTPVWAQPSIPVYKAAAFVPASIEITQDYPNFSQDLAKIFSDAKDNLEATAFTLGAGSTEPTGIVTAVAAITASRVAGTTSNVFGIEDVYSVVEDLPARYSGDASWMANLSILNLIRQFGTAVAHNYTTDLVGPTPTQLLGKPVYESSTMDSALTTGDDDILLVGDFSQFAIVDRVGMQVEMLPHLLHTSNNRPSGQRGFYAYWRTGSDVTDVNAFRLLRI